MSKRGPLSKAEIFYIDNNLYDKIPEDLAKDLDRSITSIEKYIKKSHRNRKNTIGTVGSQFARSNGTTIMTENASSMSDSKRKFSTQNRNCITKIKND